MITKINKNQDRKKRHKRVRGKVSGTAQSPRLCVYRSLNHIYVQVIDDTVGNTLAAASTLDKELKGSLAGKTKNEQAKMDMAASLMKEAVKKYDNVYFVIPNTGKDARESSVDGTHPSDMGYMAWARSIEKPILKILKKYGIR